MFYFCCVLLCVRYGDERAGCFAFLSSWCLVIPHNTTGLSAVCDCGISSSYSFTIYALPYVYCPLSGAIMKGEAATIFQLLNRKIKKIFSVLSYISFTHKT